MAFQVRPSLFIGIGTNGWQILDDLRRLFYEEFGVGGLHCFRYVGIETNKNREPENSFLPHQPQRCEVVEQIYITIPDISVIQRRLDPGLGQEYLPGLDQWLDRNLIGRGNKAYETGAGNERHAGRLCLWENWQTFKNTVTRAYQAICTQECQMEADRFLRTSYLPRKGIAPPAENLVKFSPKIYIFGTLCGGTCSGTFIDVAYFVSSLLGVRRAGILRQQDDPQVIGMFTIPDNIRVSQPTLRANVANCWAALRELDFYFQPESVYRVRFPDGASLESRDEPFDTVYLEGTRNLIGSLFSGDDQRGLTQMCAMNLFTEVVAGMADSKDEIRVNLRTTTPGYLQRNANGHIRAFSSLGLSAIWYPRYRIAKAINRQLAVAMCDGWLGNREVPVIAIQEQAQTDWEALRDRARGSLLGTVAGLDYCTNLVMEVEALFEQRESEFMAVDEYGLGDFSVNFPDPQMPLSQKLANPDGEYYRKVAYAESLVARDFKAALAGLAAKSVRERTFAEASAYVQHLKMLIETHAESLSEDLPAFSQKMDFSLAHDVHTDIWTKWLGQREAAILEYKRTIWYDLKDFVIAQLNRICDSILKRILNGAQSEMARLVGEVERGAVRLRLLRDTCEQAKQAEIKFQPPSNIVLISEGELGDIDDDVMTGAAEILRSHEWGGLRTLFVREEAPLPLLDQPPKEKLLARIDQAYDPLSQRIISRFHVGRMALANLRPQMQNLVRSSVPYVEATAAFRPLVGPQSTNFLFCHDQDTARQLVDLTEPFMAATNYTVRSSPLDHFVFYYQELPGLAISDLQVEAMARVRLDESERDPNRVATRFSHRMGEKLFDLDAIREFEALSQWLRIMEYLDPTVFKAVGREKVIEYEPEPGLPKRDLRVDHEESVRQFIEEARAERLIGGFKSRLNNLGQRLVVERMEAKANQSQHADERQALQTLHERILREVFQS